ncbi:hypothetical protein ACOACO_07240 [Nocardioides sp. CPCC 205120]|uniref:hypothetical protein n=1 Tax=Nocardioides sp. CPCC 205120 TaxID=3406462 RepID=UPI003B512277
MNTDLGDEQILKRARAAYDEPRSWNGPIPLPASARTAATRRRIRARSFRFPAPLGVAAACAAVVAIAFAGPTLFGDRGPAPSGAPSNDVPGSTAGEVSDEEAEVLAEVYAAVDAAGASPTDAAVSVDLESSRMQVWLLADTPVDLEPVVAGSAMHRGLTLETAEMTLPQRLGEGDGETARAVERMETLYRGAGERAGYVSLRAFDGPSIITVWRSTPDAETDAAAVAIADQAGLTLQVLTSRWTEDALADLGGDLIAQNDTWEQSGFTVSGIETRPSGAIVQVTGDLAAATDRLTDIDGVIRVEEGAIRSGPLFIQD